MTGLLMRLFLPADLAPDAPKLRAAAGRLSGIVGMVCNILLFFGKLAVGTLSGSVAITADAMNNLSDASSGLVTLIGFKLAEKPADAHHPYGHARYEYLSGLAVAGMVVVIGFELAKTSIEKILAPTPVAFSIPLAVVLVGSILTKLWLWCFNRKLGKHMDSAALLATAADSRNDVLSTGAVLLAAGIEALTQWQVDGIMGLAVALFILYSGASMAKETISPLLGEATSPELQQQIIHLVENCPLVLGYHDLMVHDYGPGKRFASLHVEMDQQEDPLVCHELIDNLERACYQKLHVHLVVHYDPVVTGDAVLAQMQQLTLEKLQEIDSRLTIHDFRMVQGKSHTNLIFDVAMPPDLWNTRKEIQRQLDTVLSQKTEMTIHTVITFDPEAFQP